MTFLLSTFKTTSSKNKTKNSLSLEDQFFFMNSIYLRNYKNYMQASYSNETNSRTSIENTHELLEEQYGFSAAISEIMLNLESIPFDEFTEQIKNNISKKDSNYKILKDATKSKVDFKKFLDEQINLVANKIKYFDSTQTQSLSQKELKDASQMLQENLRIIHALRENMQISFLNNDITPERLDSYNKYTMQHINNAFLPKNLQSTCVK